jgi:hypothetical protein
VLGVGACAALFYQPVRDVPGPDLMPLLTPEPSPPDPWTLTPRMSQFSTFVQVPAAGVQNRPAYVSIVPAPLPGGARLEARIDGDDSCRVVRVGADEGATTVRAWHDRNHCDRRYSHGFAVSPDGAWVLYTLPREPGATVARVRAFPVAGGGAERVWDVPIEKGQVGITSASWRGDGRGWLGWDLKDIFFRQRDALRSTAPSGSGGAPGFGGTRSMPATLWTADLGDPPGTPPRPVVTVADMADYPAVLGRADDGLTLGIDRTDTRFTSRFRADAYERGSYASVSRTDFYASLPKTGGKPGPRPPGRMTLVAFDEAQGVHIVRRVTVPVPPECDSATVTLSPDGHTLAWWVHTNPVMEIRSEVLRQWDPRRFGGMVLRRRGADSLWIGDARTGALRQVGVLRETAAVVRPGQVPLPPPVSGPPRWSAAARLLFAAPGGKRWYGLALPPSGGRS